MENAKRNALCFRLQELDLLRPDGKLNELGLEAVAYLVDRLPEIWGPAFIPLNKAGVHEAIELIIVQGKNVLLVWREDRHFHGWHTPGVMRRQGESYQVGATRCAQSELGCDVRVVKPIAPVDHLDSPRFHEAGVLLLCDLVGEPQRLTTTGTPQPGDCRWFNACPAELLTVQRKYWQHIKLLLAVR